jgi:demethylmenaquinone methyltransferase / 2-methoxy-6-polyprenyl-1,4-benzoquinol methylase
VHDKKPFLHAENPFELKKRSRPLHRIFTAVPPTYDLINRIFTLTLDERWRKIAAENILAINPEKIMDLCTGTGDLAVRLANMTDGKIEITGYDYSQPMLDIAKKSSEGR